MKKQILIIDDEADFSFVLKLSLEAEGYYNVREENDPRKALAAAREFMPDVIVLDVMMPWLHGRDVADKLKADPQFTDTPLVFLTALDEATAGPPECGNHVCLPKGAPVKKLVEGIEQLVSRGRAQRTDLERDQMQTPRLRNLRRSRQACPEAQRFGFDIPIENAERALATMGRGDGSAPGVRRQK